MYMNQRKEGSAKKGGDITTSREAVHSEGVQHLGWWNRCSSRTQENQKKWAGNSKVMFQPKHQKEQPSLQIAVNYQSLALKCLEPVL